MEAKEKMSINRVISSFQPLGPYEKVIEDANKITEINLVALVDLDAIHLVKK